MERPTVKKKIIAITGTRADYGLLRPILRRIQKSKYLSLKLIVTRMHNLKKYGMTINEIKKDRFPISRIIKVGEGDDMVTAFNKEVSSLNEYFSKNRPDMLLLQGDRGEQLAGAIVAGHLKIPIAHVHGGDLSGYTIDEYIRHSITKFSHLHFAASKKSMKRIIQMGEESWRVYQVGAPGLDNLKEIKYLNKIDLGKKLNLNPDKKWFILLHHPTPLDKTNFIGQIRPFLKVMSAINGEKILIYPNSDTGSSVFIKEIERYRKHTDFHIFKNTSRNDYLNLLKTGDMLVGNSSSGIIESTYFKIPTINIGNRQRGRECGSNVINADYSLRSIRKAVDLALSSDFKLKSGKSYNPYGKGGAGNKIVTALEKHVKNDRLLYKEFKHVKI